MYGGYIVHSYAVTGLTNASSELPTPSPMEDDEKSIPIVIIVGPAAGGSALVVVALLVAAVLAVQCMRRRKAMVYRLGGSQLQGLDNPTYTGIPI